MKTTQSIFIFAALFSSGCAEYDTLSGSWGGDLSCGNRPYAVQMSIQHVGREHFVYTGKMLMSYEAELTNFETFQANFLYSFDVVQPLAAGGQDVLFEMTWDDIGCQSIYGNGEIEAGGCADHGINTDELYNSVGDIWMRFNGVGRLQVNDEHCVGDIFRQ